MSNLKELGVALRAYRVAAGESIQELADATEVSPELIKQMEAGLHAPSDEVIELISRHFSLREQEVKRIYELAGHDSEDFQINLAAEDFDIEKLNKDFEVLLAPIFYTDMVNVISNEFGVTINFIQNASGSEKPIVVSRVGMSHKHAESILEVLQETVRRSKAKQEEDNSHEVEGSN